MHILQIHHTGLFSSCNMLCSIASDSQNNESKGKADQPVGCEHTLVSGVRELGILEHDMLSEAW